MREDLCGEAIRLAQLLALAPSPVVALNRAVAHSMLEGPESALAALEKLSTEAAMKSYYLLPAVRADFLRRLGRSAQAAACYNEALTYPCSEPERRFLLTRLDGLMAETRTMRTMETPAGAIRPTLTY